MTNIREVLKDIFQLLKLNETETRIFTNLLQSSQQSIAEIAANASLKRTNAYNYVEQLEKKGLIYKVPQAKTLKYQAANPEKIKVLLEDHKVLAESKIKELEKILPSLKSLESTKDEIQVKFYQGKEGLKLIHKEIIKSKNIKLMVHSDLNKPFFPKIRDQFHKNSREKKSNIMEIRSHANKDANYNPTKHNPNHKVRFLDKDTQIESDQIIYDNKVILFSYQNKFIGVEINNPFIFKTQNQLFDFIWQNIK